MVGNRHEYEVMAACEDDLWWYKNLHFRVLLAIRKRFGDNKNLAIFDAGCGTGGLINLLQKNGYEHIQGLDVSEDAVFFCRKRGLNVVQDSILNIDDVVGQDSVDVLISNDNLYFFEDKLLVLQKYARILKRGGICIMNLPALDCFAGTHDKAVGIEKRFDLKSFKQMVDKTDFQMDINVYWPFFLSPIVLFTRLLQRLANHSEEVTSDVKMPTARINNLLFYITKMEVNLPIKGFFGSSLFVVLKRK